MARGGFSRRRGPMPVKLYAILGGIFGAGKDLVEIEPLLLAFLGAGHGADEDGARAWAERRRYQAGHQGDAAHKDNP